VRGSVAALRGDEPPVPLSAMLAGLVPAGPGEPQATVTVTGDEAGLGEAARSVLFRAAQEAPGPRVDVEDNGPGIAPAQRRAVFERFYRADRSRSTPGFGLGLSIVEAIVRLHGFQAEVGDAAAGACLTVRCWPPG